MGNNNKSIDGRTLGAIYDIFRDQDEQNHTVQQQLERQAKEIRSLILCFRIIAIALFVEALIKICSG